MLSLLESKTQGKGKCNVGVCHHCWRARHKVKVNAMLVSAVIVGEQDTSKKVNTMLVFAVIVGEQDTSKKVNAMLVFAVIVGEQDTSK